VSEPDDEGFLARWARRKREAVEAAEAAPPADAPAKALEGAACQPADAAEAPLASKPPTFDLSALPPIDQITAATDIRPFLAPGVPAELTRAALRRAWVADPQIRDFIGIAENQWDFTDPNAIPGFGTLGPLDDVAKLVARVVGGMGDTAGPDAPAATAVSQSPPQPPAGDPPAAVITADENVPVTCRQPAVVVPTAAVVPCDDAADETAAPQKETASGSAVPTRRGHGGALPS